MFSAWNVSNLLVPETLKFKSSNNFHRKFNPSCSMTTASAATTTAAELKPKWINSDVKSKFLLYFSCRRVSKKLNVKTTSLAKNFWSIKSTIHSKWLLNASECINKISLFVILLKYAQNILFSIFSKFEASSIGLKITNLFDEFTKDWLKRIIKFIIDWQFFDLKSIKFASIFKNPEKNIHSIWCY